MKYQKRDCDIVFELSLIGQSEGHQSCRFSICGEQHKWWLSYAVGALFGDLLDCIYSLLIDLNDPKTNYRQQHICYDPDIPHCITGVVTATTWDNEGETLDWKLSRELVDNPENMVTVQLHYFLDSGEKEYQYHVRLFDLCYAVTKAVTETLKEAGICGYHFSSVDDSIDMVHFLLLKQIALTQEIPNMETEDFFNTSVYRSSFAQEIELIAFEM